MDSKFLPPSNQWMYTPGNGTLQMPPPSNVNRKVYNPIDYVLGLPHTQENVGHRKLLKGDIENLQLKWTRNQGPQRKPSLDLQKGNKLIIVMRRIPFDLKLHSDWQQVYDLEATSVHTAYNTSSSAITAGAESSINASSAAVCTNEELTSFPKDFLSFDSNWKPLSNEVASQGGKLVGDVAPSISTVDDQENSRNLLASDDIWTIVRDSFSLDLSRFVPASMEKIVVGEMCVNLNQYTSDPHALEYLRSSMENFLSSHGYVHVFLSEKAKKETYSEELLKPIFHYCTPPLGTGFNELDWPGYQKLNEEFVEAVCNVYEEGDYVLVFDYPLMLVPKLLKQRCPYAYLGFYLTTVFPSSEMYRILPQREKLLQGILSAQFVGFHAFQYKRHFLTTCMRVLGVDVSDRGIEPCAEAGGTGSRAVCVPLGVDTEKWVKQLSTPDWETKVQQLVKKFGTRKIIIGIDEADYVRGILHKIMAFGKFLIDHPEWASNVVLLQLTVNTATATSDVDGSKHRVFDVGNRRDFLPQIYQECALINAHFGSIDALPVHFLFTELSIEDLAPLYASAHIAVMTSLRESLCSAAYEYIVCQRNGNKGALILSEFSASTQSLGAAALCVNPWDINSFATTIYDALVMSDQEKLVRHDYAYNYVMKHDIQMWGRCLISEFKQAVTELEHEKLNIPRVLSVEDAVQSFEYFKHRFIILGFKGVLFPCKSSGFDAELFGYWELPRNVEKSLKILSGDANTTVFLISSANVQVIERATSSLQSAYVFAENGHFSRSPNSPNGEFLPEYSEIDISWQESVEAIFKYFIQRTPGSFIHKTLTAVSWHYQDTQRDHGSMQARDLLMQLSSGPLRGKNQADIAVGSESVEVRSNAISKASIIEKYLKEVISSKGLIPSECLFLCLGNFLPRDEDVFQTFQKISSFGMKIPHSSSSASSSCSLVTENSADFTEVGFESNQASQQYNKNLQSSSYSKRWPVLNVDADLTNLWELTNSVGQNPLAIGPTLTSSSSQQPINTTSSGRCYSPSNVLTCTVGRKQSRAEFHLADDMKVSNLLNLLAHSVLVSASELANQSSTPQSPFSTIPTPPLSNLPTPPLPTLPFATPLQPTISTFATPPISAPLLSNSILPTLPTPPQPTLSTPLQYPLSTPPQNMAEASSATAATIPPGSSISPEVLYSPQRPSFGTYPFEGMQVPLGGVNTPTPPKSVSPVETPLPPLQPKQMIDENSSFREASGRLTQSTPAHRMTLPTISVLQKGLVISGREGTTELHHGAGGSTGGYSPPLPPPDEDCTPRKHLNGEISLEKSKVLRGYDEESIKANRYYTLEGDAGSYSHDYLPNRRNAEKGSWVRVMGGVDYPFLSPPKADLSMISEACTVKGGGIIPDLMEEDEIARTRGFPSSVYTSSLKGGTADGGVSCTLNDVDLNVKMEKSQELSSVSRFEDVFVGPQHHLEEVGGGVGVENDVLYKGGSPFNDQGRVYWMKNEDESFEKPEANAEDFEYLKERLQPLQKVEAYSTEMKVMEDSAHTAPPMRRQVIPQTDGSYMVPGDKKEASFFSLFDDDDEDEAENDKTQHSGGNFNDFNDHEEELKFRGLTYAACSAIYPRRSMRRSHERLKNIIEK